MIEIECCSYNDRLITMDPPEQLRLPMFIVGSMRASEFDVFVIDAGGQLPVSDALFFVAGDWPPAACRSLFPLVHQEGIAIEQAIGRFKNVFWAFIVTNQDELAFLGCRAGRRVSVSKLGLSRRDRDGWQVCKIDPSGRLRMTMKLVRGQPAHVFALESWFARSV